MRKIIISILLILFIYKIFAQNEPNPIPASPTATEIGKYGSMPISYYNGTPNINIPLYSLKVGSFELPISLSYHASGIRIEDTPSWVGLGWSLNAGGAITVGIKGLSDFNENRLNIRSETDLKNLDIPTQSELDQVAAGAKDAEPDVYNYNFCGYTGQFMIDEDHNVHFLKNNNGIKINCIYSDKKFEAIDNYGRKYIFDIIETTNTINYFKDYNYATDAFYNNYDEHGGDQKTSITAWLLKEIVLENGNGVISFLYTDEITKEQTRYSGTIIAGDPNNSNPTIYYQAEWLNGSIYGNDIPTFSYSKNTNYSKRLTEIKYDRTNTRLVLDAGFNRDDLKNSKALTKLEVYDNTIRKFYWEFNYNYFISDYPITGFGGNELHKRLRLNGLQKISGDGLLSETPYLFKYYGDEETDLKLPRRNSYDGFDHWGYCNQLASLANIGKLSRLFPYVQGGNKPNMKFICLHNATIMEFMDIKTSVPQFNGGNRSPNAYYAKGFTLKEIKYPTGGYTKFYYDGHEYTAKYSQLSNGPSNGNVGGIRIKRITDSIPGKSINERIFNYSGGIAFGDPFYLQPIAKYHYYERDVHSSILDCGHFGTLAEPISANKYMLTSSSIDNMYTFGGDYISYAKVEEISKNGKVVYEYTSRNDYNISYSYNFYFAYRNFPFEPTGEWDGYIYDARPVYPFSTQALTAKIYKCGNIKKIEYYNSSGNIVKGETYNYIESNLETIFGNRVARLFNAGGTDGTYIMAFYHQTGKSFLKSKTVTDYTSDGVAMGPEITEYIYNTNYELLKEEKTINSKGETVKTNITYPFDYPDLTFEESNGNRTPIHKVLRTMEFKNMLNYPVEISKSINGSVYKDGNLTIYGDFSGKYLPQTIYKYRAGVPLTASAAFDGRTVSSNYYNPTIFFDSYDTYGNIMQYHKNEDVNVSFQWGYSKFYPTAKVMNAGWNQSAFTSFESGTGNEGWACGHGEVHYDAKTGNRSVEEEGSTIRTTKTISAGKYKLSLWAKNVPGYTSGAITVDGQSMEPFWPGNGYWNFGERTINLTSDQVVVLQSTDGIMVDEIRLYPTDAQMTTYTYEPLVGITSQTDPNGKTTFYEYDGFGRLTAIKDNDQTLLKEYSYHIQEKNLEAPVISSYARTASYLQIQWNAVSGAESYNVYRSVDNGSLDLIASGVTTTSYRDNNITYNTSNKYVIRSVKGELVSDFGQTKVIYTLLRTPVFTTSSSNVCAGSTANYSVSSISGASTYEWTLPSGAIITSGNGTASITVQFGTISGNISVKAINSNTYSATKTLYITVNPLPVQRTISDPSTCLGTAVNIVLSTSQLGVNYQLRLDSNDSNVGPAVAGTGGDINFSVNPGATTQYNVLATNATTTCSLEVPDKSTVTVNPLPVQKTVSDPSTCSGTAVNIVLSTSESGVSYQLRLNSNNLHIGSAVTGTGGNINLPASPSSTTLYNILATKGTCSLVMTDKPTINVNPLPAEKMISDPTICLGETGNIDLRFSESGVSYQLRLNSNNLPIGSAVTGTGGTINLPASPSSTTLYNVLATKGTCSLVMADKPTINVNPLPAEQTVSDPTICVGETGNIFLRFSELDVSYQLRLNSNNSLVGSAVTGTGRTINLPASPSSTTLYNILATKGTCSLVMADKPTINVNPLPVAATSVSANTTICRGSSTTLSYSGGSGTTFKWYTSLCGGTLAGTGNNVLVSPTETTTYYGRWENSCGNSDCKTITIKVNSIPDPPSVINGNTTVISGTSQLYNVTNVLNVTYTWSLPSGWAGTSTTNSITTTAGTTGGTIMVTPSNECGSGPSSSLPVTIGSTLNIDKTNLFFNSTGGTQSFTISSNTSWSISDNATWLTVSPISGSNTATINVTCAFFKLIGTRTGVITITGGGTTKTINVTQANGFIER